MAVRMLNRSGGDLSPQIASIVGANAVSSGKVCYLGFGLYI